MATQKSQRIAIGIIAGVLAIGTIGSFMMIIFANKSGTTPESIRADQQQAELQKQYQQLLDEQNKQAKALSDQYYDGFKSYESHVGTFDAAAVSTLQTNDLKQGDGATVTDSNSYQAYYIGWTPDGKIFDSSLDTDQLKAPLSGGSGVNLIEGWDKGVIGMKSGGVRELTIPAAQAYGEKGSGDAIPPNTPIKFIIQVISVS